MAIPVATTTIDVWRRDPDTAAVTDPWEAADDPEVSTQYSLGEQKVRATIAVGNGTQAGRTVGPGDSEAVQFTLSADPCTLSYLDVVKDRTTGAWYQVEWAIQSPGLFGALASTVAGLSTRKGAGA